MINGSPAATMQKRTLHRAYAEVGNMRESFAGGNQYTKFNNHLRQSSLRTSFLFYNLTEETGQQTLAFLLESRVDAGMSQAFTAPTCWIDGSKLMVTTHIMRPVKEIIS